jgi:hypothetical protein
MRSLENSTYKIMTTPKEDNCAGIPGDYISFSVRDTSSANGFANFKLPITRTIYEYEEPESGQMKFIDHSKVSLFGKNTEYSGVLNPPVPTASAASPGRFANHRSSSRNLFATVKNPLSSTGQGKTRKRKTSKRRKTYRR